MNVIIFCGIQASGKSSFYKQFFFNSHVRISMDLLKTRHRESIFIESCLQTEQSFVVDNTNPTPDDRIKYINQIRAKRSCEIICYYFQSVIEDALIRNAARAGNARIPEVGIKAVYKKMVLPSYDEGFDKIFYVAIKENEFEIKDWVL